MLRKRVLAFAWGFDIGLAVLLGSALLLDSAPFTSAAQPSHGASLRAAPAGTPVSIPSMAQFCQAEGAQLLGFVDGRSQPVSLGTCVAFVQSQEQAVALVSSFCEQAHNGVGGEVGALIRRSGGPFATAGQCTRAIAMAGGLPPPT